MSRHNLGTALRHLRPVHHALSDPYFKLISRPVDSAWHYAKFTGYIAGFNPLHDAHYFPSQSAIAKWLADPSASFDSPQEQERLAKEVLHLCHDYLHSWAYRAINYLQPTLNPSTPIKLDNLELQAFLLVLTEAVAVVGLDYWYLCIMSVGKRCQHPLPLGPCTVHYQEHLIDEYRNYNPGLKVQHPDFFIQIVRLYTTGYIAGFTEQDLLSSRALARWLIRELLIAPRQREVARLWLSRMGGCELDDRQVRRPFVIQDESLDTLITQLSQLLWSKVKNGAHLFFEPSNEAARWRHEAGPNIDFRFFNINQLGSRDVHWPSSSHGVNSWSYYVDQMLSAHFLPDCQNTRREIQQDVNIVRNEFDAARLERLLQKLELVPGARPDIAPQELLFIN